MSVCRKLPDGTIQKIAGHTILLDANVSEVRHGRWNLVSAGVGWVEQNIIFTDPMPDNDYIVIIESDAQTWAAQPGPYRITNKTTTGFTVASFNTSNASSQVSMNIAGTYTAFKLVKLDGYTELQNKVNNPDSAPTEDSLNLVTSGGVYDAILSASKIFVNSESAWNELDAETKATYQVAILTDKPTVNAVDSTDGTTTVVGEPNKRWVGTQAEWGNLTTAEKAKYEVVCFTDGGDAPPATQFATISNEGAASTVGVYICSKNGKNVCVMLKGRTNGIVTNSTKLYSGFFNPLTPNNYSYLDIPFAIRNRTTNVTEMRMGYLDANGNFYTSAYTEDIASDWDIQLFFSYQTE